MDLESDQECTVLGMSKPPTEPGSTAEQTQSTSDIPVGMAERIPERVNEMALAAVSQLAAIGSNVLGGDWDHGHLTISTGYRWTEEADLLEYGIDIGLTHCPTWVCGQPDDGGTVGWHRAPHSGKLVDSECRGARSDEELAALAIRRTCTDARVRKIPDTEGSPDLAVDFPERSNANDAIVEVTMHTDGRKRALSRGAPKRQCKELRRDWDIRLIDSRFIGSYDAVDVLSLKRIARMMVNALIHVEREDIDETARIAEACEQAIADNWPPHLRSLVRNSAPLTVFEVTSQPSEGSAGSIRVSVAPLTFNLRNVVDVSDLKTAIQARIDTKLAKNQWGETEKEKWLAIVLDDTEAATQLQGDAFAFEDHAPDFSEIEFRGIDEVWVVAFNDSTLTILRFIGAGANWKHYARVPVA